MPDRDAELERLTFKDQVETTMERVMYTIDRRFDEDAFSSPSHPPFDGSHEATVRHRQSKLLALLLVQLIESEVITENQVDDWLLSVSQ